MNSKHTTDLCPPAANRQGAFNKPQSKRTNTVMKKHSTSQVTLRRSGGMLLALGALALLANIALASAGKGNGGHPSVLPPHSSASAETLQPLCIWIVSQPAQPGAPGASYAPDGMIFHQVVHAYDPSEIAAA